MKTLIDIDSIKFSTELIPLYHEIANEEPLMDETIISIATDMIAHGYDKSKPILMYEDQILDGRNRYVASGAVGVKPSYKVFKGTYDEAVLESERRNNFRRNLSPSQLAAKAAYAIQRNKEDRELYKNELLEKNPTIGKNKLAVEIGKKFPILTGTMAEKKYAVNSKYITQCLTFLNEEKFDMSEMVRLIFLGKMEISTARYRYKELKEKYMLSSKETRVYTDEELLIFEKEDLAKNHPRAAAVEIVATQKANDELRESINDHEEIMEEMAEKIAQLQSENTALVGTVSMVDGHDIHKQEPTAPVQPSDEHED